MAFYGGKGTGYEGGFRCPAMIRWPGHIPADRVENGMIRVVVSAPEYSLVDDYEFFHAPEFSAEVLFPQLMSLDMTKLGLDFQVPISNLCECQ
jgi:hypothetical protein